MKNLVIAATAYLTYIGYNIAVSAAQTMSERAYEIDAVLNAVQ
jgi:hypothetical protein